MEIVFIRMMLLLRWIMPLNMGSYRLILQKCILCHNVQRHKEHLNGVLGNGWCPGKFLGMLSNCRQKYLDLVVWIGFVGVQRG